LYIIYLSKKWVIFLLLTNLSIIPSLIYWKSIPTGQDIYYERNNARLVSAKGMSILFDEYEDKNKKMPSEINDLISHDNTSWEDFSINSNDFQMPKYLAGKDVMDIPNDAIILYETQPSPEFKYYSHSLDKGGWYSIPQGRYVLYMNKDIRFLDEIKFQEQFSRFTREGTAE